MAETTFYSSSGDGYVKYANAADWATAQGSADGNAVDYTSADNGEFCEVGIEGDGQYRITRGFLPFDTSGLPDTATILAATLSIYADSNVIDDDNDGDDWINIVQASQAATNQLVNGDYDTCGDSVDDPTEGATRIDIGNINANQYNTWTLNATGRGWISKTGYTKLGVREGHDCLDNAYVGGTGTYNRMGAYNSEETGTTKDPKLVVTYSEETTTTTPSQTTTVPPTTSAPPTTTTPSQTTSAPPTTSSAPPTTTTSAPPTTSSTTTTTSVVCYPWTKRTKPTTPWTIRTKPLPPCPIPDVTTSTTTVASSTTTSFFEPD